MAKIVSFNKDDISEIKKLTERIQRNSIELTNDFLLFNVKKVLKTLNELPLRDFKKEKVIRLLELLKTLSTKTYSLSLIEELIKLNMLHTVLRKYLFYFINANDFTFKYKKLNLACIFATLTNMTNICELMSIENSKQGLLKVAFTLIETDKLLIDSHLSEEDSLNLYNRLLGFILSNARWPIVKHDLIKLNIVDVILKHKNELNNSFLSTNGDELNSKFTTDDNVHDLMKLKVDMTSILSRLFNDHQLSQLDLSEDLIKTFIEMLENVIVNSNTNKLKLNTKYYLTYVINNSKSCVFLDCILARLFTISINDVVKQVIFDLGALQFVIKLLKDINIYPEKRWCCELLCSLCFNEDVKRSLRSNKPAQELIKQKLKEEKYVEIKIQCIIIMELINETLRSRLANSRMGTNSIEDAHIMISYEEKSEAKCVKLVNLLRNKGFKIWISAENRHKNPIEAIANGVENAFIFLLCYTDEYRESNICRLEAEYAFESKLPILTIKTDTRFQLNSNSWFSPLISKYSPVDLNDFFNNDVNYTTGLNSLLKQIQFIYTFKSGQKSDHVSQISKNKEKVLENKQIESESFELEESSLLNFAISNPSRKTNVTNIWHWSSEDFRCWLVEKNLEEFIDVFKDFNGVAVISLCNMKRNDYKRFCGSIDKEIEKLHYEIPFHKKLLFYELIDELYAKYHL